MKLNAKDSSISDYISFLTAFRGFLHSLFCKDIMFTLTARLLTCHPWYRAGMANSLRHQALLNQNNLGFILEEPFPSLLSSWYRLTAVCSCGCAIPDGTLLEAESMLLWPCRNFQSVPAFKLTTSIPGGLSIQLFPKVVKQLSLISQPGGSYPSDSIPMHNKFVFIPHWTVSHF